MIPSSVIALFSILSMHLSFIGFLGGVFANAVFMIFWGKGFGLICVCKNQKKTLMKEIIIERKKDSHIVLIKYPATTPVLATSLPALLAEVLTGTARKFVQIYSVSANNLKEYQALLQYMQMSTFRVTAKDWGKNPCE